MWKARNVSFSRRFEGRWAMGRRDAKQAENSPSRKKKWSHCIAFIHHHSLLSRTQARTCYRKMFLSFCWNNKISIVMVALAWRRTDCCAWMNLMVDSHLAFNETSSTRIINRWCSRNGASKNRQISHAYKQQQYVNSLCFVERKKQWAKNQRISSVATPY